MSRRRIAAVAIVAVVFAGCRSGATSDPKSAADDFAKAAERGDADAIYGMMTETDRATYARDDVRKLVGEQKEELRERAAELRSPNARIRAEARLRFDDGEEVQLDLERHRFWITAASALPGGSRTPEQALDQLRRVLSRRSYAGLMRVLSPSTRAAVEHDVRSFVDGLERPDTLDVRTTGDVAEVTVPGGHFVKLKREGGVWRVEDFD